MKSFVLVSLMTVSLSMSSFKAYATTCYPAKGKEGSVLLRWEDHGFATGYSFNAFSEEISIFLPTGSSFGPEILSFNKVNQTVAWGINLVREEMNATNPEVFEVELDPGIRRIYGIPLTITLEGQSALFVYRLAWNGFISESGQLYTCSLAQERKPN